VIGIWRHSHFESPRDNSCLHVFAKDSLQHSVAITPSYTVSFTPWPVRRIYDERKCIARFRGSGILTSEPKTASAKLIPVIRHPESFQHLNPEIRRHGCAHWNDTLQNTENKINFFAG
jgi:hypothetical protein